MPWQVHCPGCGAEQTNAANEILAREAGGQPPLKLPNRPEPPRPARDPELIGAHGTMASNPAKLRVNWAKAYAARPAPLVANIMVILFGVVVCCALAPHVIGLIFIFIPLIVWRNHYREVRQKFYAGDVCPGMVIAKNLVAVMTDLRTGAVQRPAIKVIRYPMSHMTGGRPEVGARVATVALYRGPAQDNAWRDFSPEVIACWVTDENEIQRVTNCITEPEWRQLGVLLERLPQAAPGLYRMWGANAGKAKPAMNPFLEVLLTIVALAAIFVGPTYGMVHQWKLKHPKQTASAPAQPQPATEETPAPDNSTPAPPAVSAPASRPAPRAATAPRPAAPARPVAPSAIDLAGQFMTFTNLQGKSFENVRLVKADPRAGLVYSFEGGAGSVPFNTLPLEFLEQIGVPTNWPGVMPGRAVAAAPTAEDASPRNSPGFAVGDKVEVQWAGKWQPAKIVGFVPYNITVRFSDPNTIFKNAMNVPTNWVRKAP